MYLFLLRDSVGYQLKAPEIPYVCRERRSYNIDVDHMAAVMCQPVLLYANRPPPISWVINDPPLAIDECRFLYYDVSNLLRLTKTKSSSFHASANTETLSCSCHTRKIKETPIQRKWTLVGEKRTTHQRQPSSLSFLTSSCFTGIPFSSLYFTSLSLLCALATGVLSHSWMKTCSSLCTCGDCDSAEAINLLLLLLMWGTRDDWYPHPKPLW